MCLGILIDDQLNWKERTGMIKSKLSKTVAVIYRAKYLLDKNSLFILCCSPCLPYISYCCEVWGNTGVYILLKRLSDSCVMSIHYVVLINYFMI